MKPMIKDMKGTCGIVFSLCYKTKRMIPTCTSTASKKLALNFILENIDYRKKCLFLQEIISLGKIDEVWNKTLTIFFDNPLKILPLQKFNNN